MTKQSVTKTGEFLQQAINNISNFDNYKKANVHEEKLHVQSVADALLFAYEQLRNASENIEDHLLLQRAIQRFYVRNIFLNPNKKHDGIAKELIIELTQAEYIENDSIYISTIKNIDNLIVRYLKLYTEIKKTVNEATARKWILELMSVKTEQLINNPIRIISFAHFAHVHYSEIINYDRLIESKEVIAKEDYPTLLYIAIHRALLKSDDANIRSSLIELLPGSDSSARKMVDLNKKYDKLFALTSTTNITKFVTKNGAPIRIIRSAYLNDNVVNDGPTIISNKAQVDSIIDVSIDQEYKRVRRAVNLGVVKSIIFLLITKAIIGLLIEIPYDLKMVGSIAIMPLAINLLFPALFIAVSAITFSMPGSSNKESLKRYIQSILYVEYRESLPPPKYTQKARGPYMFNIIYIVTFILAFYLIGVLLVALKFNIIQGFIFFIFFSTASFLGYRLTLQIKELEIVTSNQGLLSTLRDFFYTPFIFAGKKISYRFSKLNIIAQILDIIIDLPLKTTVRLIRQWNIFLNNKKDELL